MQQGRKYDDTPTEKLVEDRFNPFQILIVDGRNVQSSFGLCIGFHETMRIPDGDLRLRIECEMSIWSTFTLGVEKENKHKPPESNVRAQHPRDDIARLPPK